MECVGISVTQKEPAHGAPYPPSPIITAKMVRTIPVGQFMERSRRLKTGSAEIVAGLHQKEGKSNAAEWARQYGDRFKARTGGRPREWGDDHYRKVAAIYAIAWRSGEAPTQAVERHPDFAPISHSTAARWVRECRKRGFLGKTEKRVAGGVLPPEQEEDK